MKLRNPNMIVSQRTPVENAFLAFMALSDGDKEEMVRRFSEHQAKAAHPMTLTFTTYKPEVA